MLTYAYITMYAYKQWWKCLCARACGYEPSVVMWQLSNDCINRRTSWMVVCTNRTQHRTCTELGHSAHYVVHWRCALHKCSHYTGNIHSHTRKILWSDTYGLVLVMAAASCDFLFYGSSYKCTLLLTSSTCESITVHDMLARTLLCWCNIAHNQRKPF